MARLAARLHEEAQALIDQQAVASATQRQQAQTEMAKLTTELATLQAQLAAATLSSEQDAHANTRLALHQRDLGVERLTQQVRDQTARLVEQENFRQSLEESLRTRTTHSSIPAPPAASRQPRAA